MVAYICAAVITAALSSLLFYLYAQRSKICDNKTLISITVFNALFSIVFPLLFSRFSGRTAQGTPARGLPAVFAASICCAVLYVAFVVWFFVIRSKGVKLDVPLPEPDGGYDANEAEINAAAAVGLNEEFVDTAQNIDKMGDSIYSRGVSDIQGAPGFYDNKADAYITNNGVPEAAESYAEKSVTAGANDAVIPSDNIFTTENAYNADNAHNADSAYSADNAYNNGSGSGAAEELISRAFDCLNRGEQENAAEYFIGAIEKRPPLSMEIQIALQLGMIYSNLGKNELALDVLNGYLEKYRTTLSDGDKAALRTGVDIIASTVADIGGDGNEKD